MTSSVSGKRSPAELIARDPSRRWRRESNPCARLCRPLPHHSATPPLGLMRLHHRADDGIRTRDPNLGKVVRYQLRHVRAPRASSSPIAKDDDSASTLSITNPLIAHGCRGSEEVDGSAARRPIHVRHRRGTAPSLRQITSAGTSDAPAWGREAWSERGARFRSSPSPVLIFDVVERVPRSRSSVGERPPHTRKVAGSIPAGTTSKTPA